MHQLLVTLAVAIAVIAGLVLPHQAFATAPTKVQDTGIGQVLANPEGNTLYTFDKDQPGQSACVGECEERWPPHLATESDQPEGDYTLISRADGSKQWAYKGKALYTLRDDESPGSTQGEGVGGVWHAARP